MNKTIQNSFGVSLLISELLRLRVKDLQGPEEAKDIAIIEFMQNDMVNRIRKSGNHKYLL